MFESDKRSLDLSEKNNQTNQPLAAVQLAAVTNLLNRPQSFTQDPREYHILRAAGTLRSEPVQLAAVLSRGGGKPAPAGAEEARMVKKLKA